MTSPQNFEQAILELETIVNTLEKGDLPLDDTLKTFEKGMKLSNYCQHALKEAQEKINILMNEDQANDQNQ